MTPGQAMLFANVAAPQPTGPGQAAAGLLAGLTSGIVPGVVPGVTQALTPTALNTINFALLMQENQALRMQLAVCQRVLARFLNPAALAGLGVPG